jgi:outer membrane protein
MFNLSLLVINQEGKKMNKKTVSKLVLSLLAALSFNTIAEENPWMVRVRATQLNWDNGQTGVAQALNINAKDKTIPELDVSYFFTKNIAAELVLTYPQKVNIDSNLGRLGHVKALPPTLLAQYHFTDLGPIKPYVGAGINYTRFTSRSNLLAGAASVESASFGSAVQVGADYMLTKNWGVNLDVKYIKMKTDVNVASVPLGSLELSPVVTSVGVTYKF